MPPSTPAEALRAAQALIADPEHWTRRTVARDAQGLPVGARSTTAVAWCAGGAMAAVNASSQAYDFFMEACREKVGPQFGVVPYVNDHCDHSVVIGCFRRAIEMAEQSEPTLRGESQ